MTIAKSLTTSNHKAIYNILLFIKISPIVTLLRYVSSEHQSDKRIALVYYVTTTVSVPEGELLSLYLATIFSLRQMMMGINGVEVTFTAKSCFQTIYITRWQNESTASTNIALRNYREGADAL